MQMVIASSHMSAPFMHEQTRNRGDLIQQKQHLNTTPILSIKNRYGQILQTWINMLKYNKSQTSCKLPKIGHFDKCLL